MVIARIEGMRFEKRAKYSDFAILYRGNHQAQVFETALRAKSIAYDISGGQSMFERTEIKDIVAYLRLIANDDDDPAFLRAVGAPKRGIGQTTLARLADIAAQRHESLFAAAFAPELAAALPARQREALAEFCTLINSLRYRAEREPAKRLLDELMSGIRLRGVAHRNARQAGRDRARQERARFRRLARRARARPTGAISSSSRSTSRSSRCSRIATARARTT